MTIRAPERARSRALSRPLSKPPGQEAEFQIVAHDHVAERRRAGIDLPRDLRGRPAVGTVVHIEDQRQTGRARQIETAESRGARRLGGEHRSGRDERAEGRRSRPPRRRGCSSRNPRHRCGRSPTGGPRRGSRPPPESCAPRRRPARHRPGRHRTGPTLRTNRPIASSDTRVTRAARPPCRVIATPILAEDPPRQAKKRSASSVFVPGGSA